MELAVGVCLISDIDTLLTEYLELSRRTSPGGGSYSGYFGEAATIYSEPLALNIMSRPGGRHQRGGSRLVTL